MISYFFCYFFPMIEITSNLIDLPNLSDYDIDEHLNPNKITNFRISQN